MDHHQTGLPGSPLDAPHPRKSPAFQGGQADYDYGNSDHRPEEKRPMIAAGDALDVGRRRRVAHVRLIPVKYRRDAEAQRGIDGGGRCHSGIIQPVEIRPNLYWAILVPVDVSRGRPPV
jgi:hypothetical protein